MPLTKNDIDAVAITLRVDERPTFMVMLTRGGLTKRMGSSEGGDPEPLQVTGRTDSCFEDFMTALPDALLAQGGFLADGGHEGPRHEWRFEFGGGVESLVYDIVYHAGSASLPEEFADLVTRAERLTHAWHLARVAEERGSAPSAAVPVPPPPPVTSGGAKPNPKSGARSGSASASAGGAGARSTPLPRSGAALRPQPATREWIALAVLVDFLVLSIPYLLFRALLSDGERASRPGAGLVLFAFVEFALLQFVRKSVGYWALGIDAPLGSRPQVAPRPAGRDSKSTLTAGAALCALGAWGLTSWTLFDTPTPWFGLPLGSILGAIVTTILFGGVLAGGLLILRGEDRGVWVGAGAGLVVLLAALIAWGDLPGWIQGEWTSPDAGPREPGAVAALLRIVLVLVPLGVLGGVAATWWRWSGKASWAAIRGASTARAAR